MKEIFEEIERIGSEKYKYYGNVFCQTNNYDVHTAITQNKIVDLLTQLVGKMDTLIEKINTPSQEKVEPIIEVEPEKKVPVKRPVKRKTTEK